MNRQLVDLTLPELFDLYDTSWTAYCAARASYHNAVREQLPELIDKYRLQRVVLGRVLEETLNEIDRRGTCAQ